MSEKKGKPVSIWLDENTEAWMIEEAKKRKWTKSFFAAEMLREKMKETDADE